MNKPAHVLHRVAKRYNRDFFDSQLPIDDVYIWLNDDIKEHGLTVSVESDEDENTGHLFFNIYIDPVKHHDKRQMYITLLHELAHVRLYPWMRHGVRHEEEMVRLAIRGAFKGLW